MGIAWNENEPIQALAIGNTHRKAIQLGSLLGSTGRLVRSAN